MTLLCLGRGTFVWCGRRFKAFGGWVYQGGGGASNLLLHLRAATHTKPVASVHMQMHVHVLHSLNCVFCWVGRSIKTKHRHVCNCEPWPGMTCNRFQFDVAGLETIGVLQLLGDQLHGDMCPTVPRTKYNCLNYVSPFALSEKSKSTSEMADGRPEVSWGWWLGAPWTL